MKIQTAIMIENIALMIFCAYMVTMTGNGWWYYVYFLEHHIQKR